MSQQSYEMLETKGAPIKAWTKGLPVEKTALDQLQNISELPFIYKHIAVMPDVHWGVGATVGSVICTHGAIIPAAVGVDIGCGMMAVKTSLKADDLPDNLKEIREIIEKAIPHGRTNDGGVGDRGAWSNPPLMVTSAWQAIEVEFNQIVDRHPKIGKKPINHCNHLGTLGGGNHFVEVCLDEENNVWFMLHSGSRGIGNRIGTYFIELAKEDMRKHFINLPDINLAYLVEGTEYLNDYIRAVKWAQEFARLNREIMMLNMVRRIQDSQLTKPFAVTDVKVNCHHNYVNFENHFGEDVYITRKGAVSAEKDKMGIIPGSMGAKSFIVKGRGNPESFKSCSHGAGRVMSRGQAKKKFTIEDHIKATEGVECRKDADVLDETPMAYKSIDDVMEAQSDLVDIIHTLKQIICVKG